MVDLFDEVEDELRTEQYKKMLLKLAPWVVGGLVAGAVVAAGVYGFIRYQDGVISKASANYSAAALALNKGDVEGAYKQFESVSSAAHGYKALALMSQAAIRLQQDKPDEAVKLFDQAAEAAPHSKSGLILADTARFKAALTLLDDSPYAEVEKRLKPLTEDGRPLRGLSDEALTLAMLNAGMIKEARAEATRLTVAPYATPSVAQRAGVLIGLIDAGDAAQIGAVTKAAKTLSPTPVAAPGNQQITPEMIEQLRAQAAAQGGGPGAAPGGEAGQ